jgi:hypothetical protein
VRRATRASIWTASSKAAHNAPFGADGRFATVQDAAQAAILSPVEMRGKSVTPD